MSHQSELEKLFASIPEDYWHPEAMRHTLLENVNEVKEVTTAQPQLVPSKPKRGKLVMGTKEDLEKEKDGRKSV